MKRKCHYGKSSTRADAGARQGGTHRDEFFRRYRLPARIRTKGFGLFVLTLFACVHPVWAQEIYIAPGNVDGLKDAIFNANQSGSLTNIRVENDGTPFSFDSPWPGTHNALPVVIGDIQIICDPSDGNRVQFLFGGSESDPFRFVEIGGNGKLGIEGCTIMKFRASSGSGGAALGRDHGMFIAKDTVFKNNSAQMDGGVFSGQDFATASLWGDYFDGNHADRNGGVLSLSGHARAEVHFSIFLNNDTVEFGCNFAVDATDSGNLQEIKAQFRSLANAYFATRAGCVDVENPAGNIMLQNDTFDAETTWHSTSDEFLLLLTLGSRFNREGALPFGIQSGQNQQQSSSGSAKSKPQATCNDFGSGAFHSLGYNIDPDNGCPLNAIGDLPNTDPLVVEDESGIPIPQPGSPAIDHGPSHAMVIENDTLASLPCSYRDLLGTGRPQDGNGDGVFECDVGAVEVAGTGAVTSGHSGAFFNAARDGEGTYVEILDGNTAVVYTFTYRPDGSGPAWFIGVGTIKGNSIVIDDLLRPIGASFGNAFNSADVEFTPIGGMSMVFPDCAAGAKPGNVAYSGDADLGYEGLITKATRLSNILGCGNETPSPWAGLSGSYFDPARDGEGIIVEWLTSGDVLVVFFTYDQNGNQLWLLGIGTPNDDCSSEPNHTGPKCTVTMDALYASSFTPWGHAYNKNDVTIEKWGTFTLIWSGADHCNAVDFSYSATVGNYGSGQHHYQRLSKLADTSCPELFP